MNPPKYKPMVNKKIAMVGNTCVILNKVYSSLKIAGADDEYLNNFINNTSEIHNQLIKMCEKYVDFV